MAQNKQLRNHITDLSALVLSSMPGIKFPFGDVISLAGKVAIEKAFPCIRIKWRPGRPICGFETELGPGGGINTFRNLKPFLQRYGFNATEMAILISGTHGLKEANLHTAPEGEKPWVDTNSGLEFIKSTFDFVWNIKRIPQDWQLETAGISHIFSSSEYIRLPADMIFFPSKVASALPQANRGLTTVDNGFAGVEQRMKQFAIQNNEHAFNKVFADVYAKMLEIGTKPGELSLQYLPNKPFPTDGAFQASC
jgi:hypothetical protein